MGVGGLAGKIRLPCDRIAAGVFHVEKGERMKRIVALIGLALMLVLALLASGCVPGGGGG